MPPYAETQNYVAMIRRLYGEERHAYDPAVASASPLAGGADAPAKPSAGKKKS